MLLLQTLDNPYHSQRRVQKSFAAAANSGKAPHSFRMLWSLRGFEQPAQRIAAQERDADEDPAQRQIVTKAWVKAEPWEHHDLRDDRQRVAQRDIGDGLDQRHAARLRHARFLDRRGGF